MSTDDEKQTLDDAIERLEAERKRRIDDKIERGEVARVTLNPVVVGCSDNVEKVIEATKAEVLARLRAAGEKREVVFEWPNNEHGEPLDVIITGVPRNDDFGKWNYELLEPQYPDRYATTATVRPRKNDDDSVAEPAPSEWKPIRVQVVAPNENTGHPGTVIEGEYAAVGGEVQVKYQGRVYAEAIKPGDDPAAVARRLLRAKWETHTVRSTTRSTTLLAAIIRRSHDTRFHRCRQSCRLYHSKGPEGLRGLHGRRESRRHV